jgi:hypothetical protein
VTELLALLTQFPAIVPAITKIVSALLRHDDPVAEAERQATIIAAKEAIRLPFKEPK